jgi:hypothetical protein
MRTFILVALFGITTSGCVPLQEDEELSPDEVASVEEAVVAGCSITASAPVLAKCNPNDTSNSIIGRSTVTCTTAQSSIKVTTTLQKISVSPFILWNKDFTCTSSNTIDRLPPKTCSSFVCAPVTSGSYNTFGNSSQTGISAASGTRTF